jgi:hypothetical protein
MSIKSRTRITPLKLAGIGAIAATAMAVAPSALASTSGGVAPSASVASAKSAPFTIGVSSRTVTPGQKLTISGLAYAPAGKNVTIVSKAINSSRMVAGAPAVQTMALVEGTYHTTVRVSPAAEPGTYSIALRFGNRQVASINNLTVVSARSRAGKSASTKPCDGISFRVLHNDHAGKVSTPAGAYTISSRNMDCGTASADLASFLAAPGTTIPGWVASSPAAGRGTFTQSNSGLSFSIAKLA